MTMGLGFPQICRAALASVQTFPPCPPRINVNRPRIKGSFFAPTLEAVLTLRVRIAQVHSTLASTKRKVVNQMLSRDSRTRIVPRSRCQWLCLLHWPVCIAVDVQSRSIDDMGTSLVTLTNFSHSQVVEPPHRVMVHRRRQPVVRDHHLRAEENDNMIALSL